MSEVLCNDALINNAMLNTNIILRTLYESIIHILASVGLNASNIVIQPPKW